MVETISVVGSILVTVIFVGYFFGYRTKLENRISKVYGKVFKIIDNKLYELIGTYTPVYSSPGTLFSIENKKTTKVEKIREDFQEVSKLYNLAEYATLRFMDSIDNSFKSSLKYFIAVIILYAIYEFRVATQYDQYITGAVVLLVLFGALSLLEAGNKIYKVNFILRRLENIQDYNKLKEYLESQKAEFEYYID